MRNYFETFSIYLYCLFDPLVQVWKNQSFFYPILKINVSLAIKLIMTYESPVALWHVDIRYVITVIPHFTGGLSLSTANNLSSLHLPPSSATNVKFSVTFCAWLKIHDTFSNDSRTTIFGYKYLHDSGRLTSIVNVL